MSVTLSFKRGVMLQTLFLLYTEYTVWKNRILKGEQVIWSSAKNQSKMRENEMKDGKTQGRLAQSARVVRQLEECEEGQKMNVNVDVEESVGIPQRRSLQCPPNSCRNPVIPVESGGFQRNELWQEGLLFSSFRCLIIPVEFVHSGIETGMFRGIHRNGMQRNSGCLFV